MRHSPRFWLLLMLPMLIFLTGARKATLVDPDPVAVPAGISIQTVQREIKRALIGRGWIVTGESEGLIETSLHLRSHIARAVIRYDTRQVLWTYDSSENLAYKEQNGERRIHKNYLSWVNNVLTDLSRSLQFEATE